MTGFIKESSNEDVSLIDPSALDMDKIVALLVFIGTRTSLTISRAYSLNRYSCRMCKVEPGRVVYI